MRCTFARFHSRVMDSCFPCWNFAACNAKRSLLLFNEASSIMEDLLIPLQSIEAKFVEPVHLIIISDRYEIAKSSDKILHCWNWQWGLVMFQAQNCNSEPLTKITNSILYTLSPSSDRLQHYTEQSTVLRTIHSPSLVRGRLYSPFLLRVFRIRISVDKPVFKRKEN